MLDADATVPLLVELPRVPGTPTTKWFSDRGCVIEDGDERQVFVGGVLVGRFEVGDTVVRNVLLVNLASNEGQHQGRLARAFSIGDSTLGDIRRRYARGGLDAVVRVRKSTGRRPKLNERQRRSLERQFDKGKQVPDLIKYAEQRYGVKRTTLYRLWREWKVHQSVEKSSKGDTSPRKVQAELDFVADQDPDVEPQVQSSADKRGEPEAEDDDRVEFDGADLARDDSKTESPETKRTAPIADVRLELGTTSHVQHAGTWLMFAALMQLGLHDVVTAVALAHRIPVKGVRVVLDALVAALSLGETCVEGVRRIATPTARVLLRAKAAPSVQWVRRLLGRVAEVSAGIQDAMAKRYLARGSASELAVFYVDNHMRPYTGKYTVRKGWRMQDKRVLPGTSDYYVHDLDGRPVLRVTEPSHGHLTDFLCPIADTLRRALGLATPIVLAFDRGGAFPVAMAKLRDAGIHFVTYERRPFPLLSPSVFEPDGIVRIRKEVYTVYEERKTNLGKGRGRVRRIAVLTPKGTQINLVAVSDLPAETLLKIMIGRWCQENGFKHGNERWGINQLDSRTVVEYDPETVIPNPARRRLDHAIRIARVREGDARRKLAQLDEGSSPRRSKLEQQVADAMKEERECLALRPQMPKYVELKNSELADRLVHHTTEYKGLIDSVRIACANVESELATMLAPSLPRPREAKKVLANLFAAPGNIRVSDRNIRVTLKPATTDREREALISFVERLDHANLVLPGDPNRRHLRFRIAK